MKRCHKCGKEWEGGKGQLGAKRQPGPKDSCEACTAYLHCCRNCRFHDPSVHNQCRIPNTEWVGDRMGLNYCDEFEFAETSETVSGITKQGKALDAISNLFGEDVEVS